MSLKERLVEFLKSEPKDLQEIYNGFSDQKPTTIRGRLNENIDKCFRRISTGVYLAIQGNTKALIIEGDAWDIIKEFDDNSIDAIITDSGYTCLNKHLATGTTRKKEGKWQFKTKDIDSDILHHMFRILKKGGHFFNFLPADSKDTYDYNDNFVRMAQKEGFVFNKRFIWNKKTISMGYNGRAKYEQIVFLSKGKRRMPFDLSIPDLLSHKRIYHGKKIHEAEKPVELIMDIMKFCSKPNEIILDPFAGSMSTAKAGLRLNRHTISIEYDKKHIMPVICDA